MKKITIQISECYHRCPFFATSMDGMECNHPYFRDKEPYSSMIITRINSIGKVPEKCPLRKEQLNVTYKLS